VAVEWSGAIGHDGGGGVGGACVREEKPGGKEKGERQPSTFSFLLAISR